MIKQIYYYLYARFTGKCPYDKTLLVDISSTVETHILHCQKCGSMWNVGGVSDEHLSN